MQLALDSELESADVFGAQAVHPLANVVPKLEE